MYENDHKKITEYLIENQEKFYRLAYSYLRDRQDALDAVQDSVCKAIASCSSLRRKDVVRTWFYRILVNTCLNYLQARKRANVVPTEATGAEYYEDPIPEDDSLRRRVDSLPPDMQTVIRLRFYEEFSLEEISESTGWNLNTVKTRLYGALRKLKVTMEGEKYYE